MNPTLQKAETKYWGDCTNTLFEENKHFVYAKLMGLDVRNTEIIVNNISVLDIGGGPVSMLLKTQGLTKGRVLDPIDYPDWTKDRYKSKNIDVSVVGGEESAFPGYDEVWIYNTLPFVNNIEKVVENAFLSANVVRVFEWIDAGADNGKTNLQTNGLNEIFKEHSSSMGRTVKLSQKGCHGEAYYGTFKKGL